MNTQYKDYKIAFLGKTGVGKSSLINTLFNLDLATNVVEECTKNVIGTWIRNDNNKFNLDYDSIMIMDTPGISAALSKDEYYMPFYNHVLSLADCMIWVVQGNTRSDRADQEMLLRLKPFISDKIKKIVCINMVDKIGKDYNKNWDEKVNQPNETLQKLIEERRSDLLEKFKEIDFKPDLTLTCSVLKKYNLDKLLSSIKN